MGGRGTFGLRTRTVRGFSTKIHEGRQGKHIPGHNNYEKGKSILTIPMKEMQDLVNKFAGTGERRGPNKEVVDFGKMIGYYFDMKTGKFVPTTRGTIHYSNKGAHVVPATPRGFSNLDPNKGKQIIDRRH